MNSERNSMSRRTLVTRLGAGITGVAITAAVPVEGQASSNGTTAPFVDPTTKYPKPPYPGQSVAAIAGSCSSPRSWRPAIRALDGWQGARLLLRAETQAWAGPLPGRMPAKAPMSPSATTRAKNPMPGEVIELIEAEGRKATPIPGDLRQENYCKELVAKAIASMGELDIVVSNAGRQQQCEDLPQLTTEAFDATMKTNIYAPFWIIKAARPQLKPGSCIIATTSEKALIRRAISMTMPRPRPRQ